MKNADAMSPVSELSEDARQILAYLKNSDYRATSYRNQRQPHLLQLGQRAGIKIQPEALPALMPPPITSAGRFSPFWAASHHDSSIRRIESFSQALGLGKGGPMLLIVGTIILHISQRDRHHAPYRIATPSHHNRELVGMAPLRVTSIVSMEAPALG